MVRQWTLSLIALLCFALAGDCRAEGPVVMLTDDNIEAQVLDRDTADSIWTVLFYSPKKDKGNKATQAMWAEYAEKMKGLVKIGAVDVSKKSSDMIVDLFGVKATPAFVALPSALLVPPEEFAPVVYKGAKTVAALSTWANKQLPSDVITTCTSEDELNQFMKHAAQFPKALLFTEKPTTSTLYKALSIRYTYRLAFAEVRVQSNAYLAEKYEITTYPTLLVYLPGEHTPHHYDGQNKIEPIAEWLATYALPVEKRVEMQQQAEEVAKKKAYELRKQLVNPTQRITGPEQWNEHVMSRNLIAVLAFLDPTDANHKDYLRILNKEYRRTRKGGTRFNYAWLDSTQQQGLAQAFGVEGETPGLVFFHPKRNWFKKFVGAFHQQKIKDYTTALHNTPGLKQITASTLEVVAEQNEDLFELDPDEEPAPEPEKPTKVDETPKTKKAPSKPKEKKKTDKTEKVPENQEEDPNADILEEIMKAEKEQKKQQQAAEEMLKKFRFEEGKKERMVKEAMRKAELEARERKKKEKKEKELEIEKQYEEQDGEYIMMQDLDD